MKKFVALVILLCIQYFLPTSFAHAAAHPPGTNVMIENTVYMVSGEGDLRPYTSAGAFLSYGFNNWASVLPASAEDKALPRGPFIPPRDGTVICSDRGSDKGTCYLITNGQKAAFVSQWVFMSLGFSFANALSGDVSFLRSATVIENSLQQHRPGTLVNNNGTVYLASFWSLSGIPSMEVLSSWGYGLKDVVLANSEDMKQAIIPSAMTTRTSGLLMPQDYAALGEQQFDGGVAYGGCLSVSHDNPLKVRLSKVRVLDGRGGTSFALPARDFVIPFEQYNTFQKSYDVYLVKNTQDGSYDGPASSYELVLTSGTGAADYHDRGYSLASFYAENNKIVEISHPIYHRNGPSSRCTDFK